MKINKKFTNFQYTPQKARVNSFFKPAQNLENGTQESLMQNEEIDIHDNKMSLENKYYRRNQMFEIAHETIQNEALSNIKSHHLHSLGIAGSSKNQRGQFQKIDMIRGLLNTSSLSSPSNKTVKKSDIQTQTNQIGQKIQNLISQCQFDQDRNNMDWKNNISAEDKSTVQSLDQGFQDYLIQDFCMKLQPMTFHRGHILKHEDEDIEFMHVICSGEVGVYQKWPDQQIIENQQLNGNILNEDAMESTSDNLQRQSRFLLINKYKAGDIICDPELNLNVLPFRDKAVVLSETCLTLAISKDKYYETISDENNIIWKSRRQILKQNFVQFLNWDQEKLKRLTQVIKERVLKQGEFLFHDGMKGNNCVYILVNGVIRLEKQVDIQRENFWPINAKNWESTCINKKVLFKIQEVSGVQFMGEREFNYGRNYPVSAVCQSSNARIFVIQHRDFHKIFTRQDIEKLLLSSTLVFPDEDEVKRSIEVLEQVQKIKKNAFLNAANTNYLPRDMRDFYITSKTKKIYPWVENAQPKVKARLKEQIKIVTSDQHDQDSMIYEIDRQGNTSQFKVSPLNSKQSRNMNIQQSVSKEIMKSKMGELIQNLDGSRNQNRQNIMALINNKQENLNLHQLSRNHHQRSKSQVQQRHESHKIDEVKLQPDFMKIQDLINKRQIKTGYAEFRRVDQSNKNDDGNIVNKDEQNYSKPAFDETFASMKQQQSCKSQRQKSSMFTNISKRLLNKQQYIKAHREKDKRVRQMIPDIIQGLCNEAKNSIL
eukprot:403355273